MLLPDDFKTAKVQEKLTFLTSTLPNKYAKGVVEPFILHGLQSNDDVEWSDFPKALKDDWEWNVLGDVSGEGCKTLGVSSAAGAVGLVRPDGVLGGVWDIEELVPGGKVESWLSANLASVGR